MNINPILSFFLFPFFAKKGRTKRNKAERRLFWQERCVTPLEGTKKPDSFSPSFTRPAFGRLSELRTDFAISTFSAISRGNGKIIDDIACVYNHLTRERARCFLSILKRESEYPNTNVYYVLHMQTHDTVRIPTIPSLAFTEGEKRPSPLPPPFLSTVLREWWFYNFLPNLNALAIEKVRFSAQKWKEEVNRMDLPGWHIYEYKM